MPTICKEKKKVFLFQNASESPLALQPELRLGVCVCVCVCVHVAAPGAPARLFVLVDTPVQVQGLRLTLLPRIAGH